MAYDEMIIADGEKQNITLENRNRLLVTGVVSVVSFDDTTVILDTVKGTLFVHGYDLHLEKLSLEGGEVKVEGNVDSFEYEDTAPKSGGLLSRLFG